MTELEDELNYVKEITIYELACDFRASEYERGVCTTLEEQIKKAKKDLSERYSKVNWSTLKYGPDIR